MNRNMIFGLIAAAIIGGLFLALANRSKGGQNEQSAAAGQITQDNTQTETSSIEISAAAGQTVTIKNFAFSPSVIKAKPGQIITVINKDFAGHSLTSDDDKFDTGILGRGESGTITAPTAPGNYGFFCTPHPFMKGTLVVE